MLAWSHALRGNIVVEDVLHLPGTGSRVQERPRTYFLQLDSHLLSFLGPSKYCHQQEMKPPVHEPLGACPLSFTAVTKYPVKEKEGREEGEICSAHSLRVQSFMLEKAWQQKCEAADHIDST